MTLGFKQTFPWGEPTYFREKIILAGCNATPGVQVLCDFSEGFQRLPKVNLYPKLHTFRADPHDRWKAGRKIEMVYRGAGYKILDHFNKDIPELGTCISTQNIQIIRDPHFGCLIQVDGRQLGMATIQDLVQNDGFNSTDDFLKWFKKDWSGKIIHWTDFRY